MSEDLTKKLPLSNGETLKQILDSVHDLRLQLGETNLRLGTLEQKVDERLHDTRPIWERVAADVAELKQGLGQLQQNQEQLRHNQEQLQQNQKQLQQDQKQLQQNQEQLQQNQQQFQGSLLELQESVAFLRNESRDVRTLLRDIFRRLSIFNDTLVIMQADYRDIYDRVRGLELGGT